MKKKILYGILIFVVTISINIVFSGKVEARTSYNSELEYEENDDGGITVYATSKSIQNITVPCTIDGKNVTEIGKEAFKDCKSLKNIELPDTLETIGDYAFYGCYELEDITLPDSVYKIGLNAFSYCKKLKSIDLPYGISTIKWFTFSDCESLTEVSIPDSVTSIGWYAFKNCKLLEKISLKNIKSIGIGSFEGCTNLASVENINNNIVEIQDSTFKDCVSLKNIKLPESVEYIKKDAFYNTRLNRNHNT